MSKIVRELIERFETSAIRGDLTSATAHAIYTELIGMGYILSDFEDENVVADMLLVDIRYEFTSEDILEYLTFQLMLEALQDRNVEEEEAEGCIECEGCTGCDDDYEDDDDFDEDDDCINCDSYNDCFGENDEEEEIDEDDFVTPMYIMSLIKLDMVSESKKTEVLPQIFTSMREIQEYVDIQGMNEAVKCILFGEDKCVGSTGAIALEDAGEFLVDLDEAGSGEIILNHIPENATAITITATTNGNKNEILSADVYVIYDVTITE